MPVTGDLGPLLVSFAPDSLRVAHRVTVHACRSDQGGIALVAYSSVADRTHDLWLRVVLLHQEDSDLDVVVAGEATVTRLEESLSAPMIMRILPETSKDSGFVKAFKKSAFGSGSKCSKTKTDDSSETIEAKASRFALTLINTAADTRSAKAAARDSGRHQSLIGFLRRKDRAQSRGWK